jgi:tRNA A-37 threonylcarbamoyl transferase component Bud32
MFQWTCCPPPQSSPIDSLDSLGQSATAATAAGGSLSVANGNAAAVSRGEFPKPQPESAPATSEVSDLCSRLGLPNATSAILLEEEFWKVDQLESMASAGTLERVLVEMGIKRGSVQKLVEVVTKTVPSPRLQFTNSNSGSHSHFSSSTIQFRSCTSGWREQKKALVHTQVGLLEEAFELHAPGRWKLVEVIGGGGMATVFEAKDKLLRRVAIKSMFADADCTAQFDEAKMKQIQREAVSTMRLNHENICRCYDIYFDSQRRFCWLVLELLAGESLQNIIDEGGPLLEYRAIQAGSAILKGLKEMHDMGLIHRDIKPDNVMLGRRAMGQGEAIFKVIDLGLTRMDSSVARDEEDDFWQTQVGERRFAGTPHFMSPEQLGGEKEDRRADVWAVGVVLFQLVTGHVSSSYSSDVHVSSDVSSDDSSDHRHLAIWCE